MEWTKKENMAKSNTPEKDRMAGAVRWYYSVAQLARIFGKHRSVMTAFLIELRVPSFSYGKSKTYHLSDVIDAIEKTRWAQKDGRNLRFQR
jgi:hypothetical protein